MDAVEVRNRRQKILLRGGCAAGILMVLAILLMDLLPLPEVTWQRLTLRALAVTLVLLAVLRWMARAERALRES